MARFKFKQWRYCVESLCMIYLELVLYTCSFSCYSLRRTSLWPDKIAKSLSGVHLVKNNYCMWSLFYDPQIIVGPGIKKYSQCQGPSHGGSYMDEGTLHIRIGLPPRIVSGDYLASSFVVCARMFDVWCLWSWGCISTSYLSCDYVCGRPLTWYPVSHDGLYTILGQTMVLMIQPGSADVPQASLWL